jgi:hypothetical protein
VVYKRLILAIFCQQLIFQRLQIQLQLYVKFYISKHEDLDVAYSNFENSIIKTLDKHAPIKRRKQIPQPVPFMN